MELIKWISKNNNPDGDILLMTINFNPSQNFSTPKFGQAEGERLTDKQIDAAVGAAANKLESMDQLPDGVILPEGMTAEQYFDIIDSCKEPDKYVASEDSIAQTEALLAQMNGSDSVADAEALMNVKSPLYILAQLFSPDKAGAVDQSIVGQTFLEMCKSVAAEAQGKTHEFTGVVQNHLEELGLLDKRNGALRPKVKEALRDGVTVAVTQNITTYGERGSSETTRLDETVSLSEWVPPVDGQTTEKIEIQAAGENSAGKAGDKPITSDTKVTELRSGAGSKLKLDAARWGDELKAQLAKLMGN